MTEAIYRCPATPSGQSGKRDEARQYALLEPLHFTAEISIGMEKLR
jgi:hypothetical protein